MSETQAAFHMEPSASDVVVEHPTRSLAPVAPPAPPARLPVPQFSIDEMRQIADAIASGGLFGSRDRNAVLTLCMLAHAEGQHPAVVFRDYNIIKGRPSKTAEAMQRDFLLAGGRITWHRLDNQCADATFAHPLGGEARIDWDLDRAKAAELLDRKNRDDSPNMWQRFPRAMLRARVLSEGVRTIWPAATGGMYVVEEAMDIAADREEEKARQREEHEAEKAQLRGNAEIFAKAQVEAVNALTDQEGLDLLQRETHREVRKLARKYPDLYTSVTTAYEAKTRELQGYDPVTGETKGVAAGEPADGEPTDIYSTFERRLTDCKTVKDVGKVDADWLRVRATIAEETQGLVDDMINRRRNSLRGRR